MAGDDDGSFADLYAGTLDGRAWEVVTAPSLITTSRSIVRGQALAWWFASDDEDAPTSFSLVDVTTGAIHDLGMVGGRVFSAEISPAAEDWYWATWNDDGGIDGLWRQSLDGGLIQTVLDATDDVTGPLVFSLDGMWLAVPGFEQIVLVSLPDGQVSSIPVANSGVVGFLGNEIIVYHPIRSDGALSFPLLGITIGDGSVRTVVDGDDNGNFARVVNAADGPVLVHDDYDRDGHLQIWAQSLVDDEDHLLYTEPTPFVDLGESRFLLRSIDTPGYAPLFFESPFLGEFDPETLPESSDGLLVDVADGTFITVPSITDVNPQ